jgi:hypothetical protein
MPLPGTIIPCHRFDARIKKNQPQTPGQAFDSPEPLIAVGAPLRRIAANAWHVCRYPALRSDCSAQSVRLRRAMSIGARSFSTKFRVGLKR